MSSNTNSTNYKVYKHTNLHNGKVYIGITSTSVEKRSGSHGEGYKKNALFYRAICKYGWDSFSHEVLLSGLGIEDTSAAEIELIAKYNSTDPRFGYNISSGREYGRAGVPYSENEKRLRSEKMSGSKNPCYGKFGSDHPAYGYKHTEESKQKFVSKIRGKTRSVETREKLRNHKLSVGEWCGDNNPMSGKTYGAAPQARKVVCVETGVIFDSAKRAAELVNAPSTSISAACSGRQKTCRGFHWRYADISEVTANAS